MRRFNPQDTSSPVPKLPVYISEKPYFIWRFPDPILRHEITSSKFSVFGDTCHLVFYTTDDHKWAFNLHSSHFHHVSIYIFCKDERLDFLHNVSDLSVELHGKGFMQIWKESSWNRLKPRKNNFVVNGYIKFLFVFDEPLKSMPEIEKTAERTGVLSPSLKKFSEDIEKLIKTGEHSDVVLQCKSERFPAHRNILSTRSEVFSAMFRNDMRESKTGIVEIVDMDCKTLGLFLKYMYSGTVVIYSVDAAFSLYRVADKYSVSSLRQKCSFFMVKHLTVDIVCKVILIASGCGDSELLNEAMKFAVKKESFLGSNTWIQFADQYPQLAVKVFSKLSSK